MSKSKVETAAKAAEKKFRSAALVKVLPGYQMDFVKAVLKDGEYTIKEAETAVKAALKERR